MSDYGNFPKKWVKILETYVDDSFKSQAESSSTEELSKIIVDCAKTITNTEKDMAADEHLKNLKEELKDASSVYTGIIKGNEAKKRYCVYLLESHGSEVSDDDEEGE